MTSAQQQMRLAEELVATARRKQNLESNPYDLVNSKPIGTNFGNKFNRNAPYIKQGALDVPRGSATYTEVRYFYWSGIEETNKEKKIRYHDQDRRIVGRNPLLFDEYGDIVEEESSDEEGDKLEGEYIEENPYAEINLDELLAPLVNAAELPNHPRMSRPYHDKGLLEMIRNAENTLHVEQGKLRALKEHFIRHRGDIEWVPVGDMHTEYDNWLLATVFDGTPLAASENNGQSLAARAMGESLGFVSGANEVMATEQDSVYSQVGKTGDANEDGEVSTTKDLQPIPESSNNAADEANKSQNNKDRMDGVVEQNGISENHDVETPLPITNGNSNHSEELENDANTSTNAMGIPDAMIIDTTNTEPPNPQRMTTRALANTSPAEELPPPIHPFFIHPPPKPLVQSAIQDEDPLGMLLAYISKQTEVVKQWDALLQGLLKAHRLRREVLRWCTAEGHVGEMSDGEDWFDLEEWGLKPDELKKGKDEEEEVRTVEGTGRRGGRGRRGGAAAAG